jgi:hypothetical protein
VEQQPASETAAEPLNVAGAGEHVPDCVHAALQDPASP